LTDGENLDRMGGHWDRGGTWVKEGVDFDIAGRFRQKGLILT